MPVYFTTPNHLHPAALSTGQPTAGGQSIIILKHSKIITQTIAQIWKKIFKSKEKNSPIIYQIVSDNECESIEPASATIDNISSIILIATNNPSWRDMHDTPEVEILDKTKMLKKNFENSYFKLRINVEKLFLLTCFCKYVTIIFV